MTFNAIFWLDAHFPGVDLGFASYDAEVNLDTRLPLERELDVIHRVRGGFQDVILIDDLRIYEKGPFEHGNMDRVGQGDVAKYGLEFLEKFRKRYTIEKIYRDEGYIVLSPHPPPLARRSWLRWFCKE